jgi:Orsellinic acid/F9775 biosynthesis cluster protein D
MSNSSQYDQYVRVAQPFNVLLCVSCKYCITKDALEDHFQREHIDIPLQRRNEIAVHVNTLNLQDPDKVRMPNDVIPAIEGLNVDDGFMCAYEGCSEVWGTLNSIQKHCRNAHGWTTSIGKQNTKWG